MEKDRADISTPGEKRLTSTDAGVALGANESQAILMKEVRGAEVLSSLPTIVIEDESSTSDGSLKSSESQTGDAVRKGKERMLLRPDPYLKVPHQGQVFEENGQRYYWNMQNKGFKIPEDFVKLKAEQGDQLRAFKEISIDGEKVVIAKWRADERSAESIKQSPADKVSAADSAEKIGLAASHEEKIDQLLDGPRNTWSKLVDHNLKDAPRAAVTTLREFGRQLFSMEGVNEEALLRQVEKLSDSKNQDELLSAISMMNGSLQNELGLDLQVRLTADGRLQGLTVGTAQPGPTRPKLEVSMNPREVTAVGEHYSIRGPENGLLLAQKMPVSIAVEQLQSTAVWHKNSHKR